MKIKYDLVGAVVAVTLYRGENFSDPEKEIVAQAEFDASSVPDVLKDGEGEKSLAGYGLLKLLQDRTSQEKGAEAKVKAMGEYFNEFFSKGLWKRPSEGRKASGGGSRRKVSAVLAQAVAQLQGCTAIEAEAALKALDKDAFARVAGNEKVAELVKELQAEAGNVDLSDLA